MARFILINVLTGLGAAVALQCVWYFIFSAYNRRKGAEALQWVETACGGRARISGVRWLRPHCLLAKVRFPLRGIENARVTVQLRPRSLPAQWLLSWWGKQRETLTLDADLEQTPRVHMQVFNHRWTYSNGAAAPSDKREWDLVKTGPAVLTTRERWKEDSMPELNALMSARQNGFHQVQFRPESPQFSATIDLQSLTDPEAASKFLASLRGIAAGTSAQRQ